MSPEVSPSVVMWRGVTSKMTGHVKAVDGGCAAIYHIIDPERGEPSKKDSCYLVQ
jgi:hypothetical protein